jgi:hypothetical protein
MTGCMGCGTRLAVDPHISLADTGWNYQFHEGWICPRCGQLDLSHPRRKRGRRGPGHPMKGDD